MSQIEFAGKEVLKTIYGKIKENQKPVNVLRNLQFETSSLKENTDEYKAFYPYCLDYEISEMKENSIAMINYTPSTLDKAFMSSQARTMDGFIRLYADKISEYNDVIEIDNLIWKEAQ